MLLQEFVLNHLEECKDTMIYKEAATRQMLFIRDTISRLLGSGVDVVSTHTSKSIKLPVYKITTDKFEVIMRENFHGWKLSITTLERLPGRFQYFVKHLLEGKIDEDIPSCYFEGFKDEWVYGSMKSELLEKTDRYPRGYYLDKQFSVGIYSDYELYTFLYTLKNYRDL